MGNQKIREPKQQRSIEKRNRIIDAGFQLFCEKGYYNTNTAEIAKLAGVSTGIIYSYFKDKKDIFILSIEEYSKQNAAPMFDIINSLEKPADIEKIVKQIISTVTVSHTLVKSVHEEMQAMAHTDDDVREVFCNFQADVARRIVTIMEKHDIRPTNAYEKVHLIINIIEYLIHEIVYHNHDYLNYNLMTEEAVKAIVNMLTT